MKRFNQTRSVNVRAALEMLWKHVVENNVPIPENISTQCERAINVYTGMITSSEQSKALAGIRTSAVENEIIAALAKYEEMTIDDMVERIGRTRTTVDDRIRIMKIKGLVHSPRTRPDGAKRYKVWALGPKPEVVPRQYEFKSEKAKEEVKSALDRAKEHAGNPWAALMS